MNTNLDKLIRNYHSLKYNDEKTKVKVGEKNLFKK